MELAEQLSELFSEYSSEVMKAVDEAVKETAEECGKVINGYAKGVTDWNNYRKNFTITKTSPGALTAEYTWHVKAPDYRLTHLLEFGHATRNGGRTRKFEHIKYGQEYVDNNLANNITKKLEAIK